MCRKFTVFTVGLLVGAAALVAWKRHDGARFFDKKPAPLESQIKEQREVLAGLDDEIRKILHQVARREVDVANLKRHIKETEERQKDNKEKILALRERVKADKSLVAAGANPVPQRQERELARLVNAYKRCEAELKSHQDKLEAYNEAVDAAHEELVAYQNERRDLEKELVELEAALARVRAEEVKAKIPFDKTKLAAVRQATTKIRERIEVRAKSLELEGRYLGNGEKVNVPETKNVDVLAEVDELFRSK
jgi:chromosome segregation ATPase